MIGIAQLLPGAPASAADPWSADFNKNDVKSFVGACAAQAAFVDGFSPYAWQSCAVWIADQEANKNRIHAIQGALTIGKLIFEEITSDRAYLIYPATMTLRKVKQHGFFTGSASARGVNTL